MKSLLCALVPALAVLLLLSAVSRPEPTSPSCGGCHANNTFVPPSDCIPLEIEVLISPMAWVVVRDLEIQGRCAEIVGNCAQVDRCLSLITVHGHQPGIGSLSTAHTASVNSCGSLEIVPLVDLGCAVDGYIHADCGSCTGSSQ